MCGIFGYIGEPKLAKSAIQSLAIHAERRGKDSSGFAWMGKERKLFVDRFDERVKTSLRSLDDQQVELIFGHSRLITNGMEDNQPIVKGQIVVIHNGIVVNDSECWAQTPQRRELKIDTEIIAALALDYVETNSSLRGLSSFLESKLRGSMSCVVLAIELGEALVFSNNGSLYLGHEGASTYFSSERFPIKELGLDPIQIRDEKLFQFQLETPAEVRDHSRTRLNLIPEFSYVKSDEKMLVYSEPDLRRCNKCILPSTMPFIEFDSDGVCNYCNNYRIQNEPKPRTQLEELLDGYRKTSGTEAVMPFSGGRDSSFALHLAVKEFGMRTVAYTYDWGMVTDLGRRNISLMCAELGVENIVVAADIEAKRRNIKMNLSAWLKDPQLGMLSILTAGDKHFYKYVKEVKLQNDVSLNLWGVNPLETTHFKAGFLGVPPKFANRRVYNSGIAAQAEYHWHRLRYMMRSPGYFNSSLIDTLSGEYYRSISPKDDYHHLFDYWRWDEEEINRTLVDEYGWETSPDTTTTWRIGDGTAGFYNYVYFTVAGFSEHDTFRSNQIREGVISREEGLRLALQDNLPRYQNIQWYLDALEMDFADVIRKVNGIARLS